MFGNYESISPSIHQENQRRNFEELNRQTTPLLCRQVNVDAPSAQYGLSGIALNLMRGLKLYSKTKLTLLHI